MMLSSHTSVRFMDVIGVLYSFRMQMSEKGRENEGMLVEDCSNTLLTQQNTERKCGLWDA